MEWRVLDEHFRTATCQKPAPFGDDAIEWDYSRYARALGLTGMPGMHDLPHTGIAVVAAPPSRWDQARERYDEWAGREGWSVVGLSGHASVLAPDPVMHGLGRAVAGDGPIFFRSGRSGAPAIGGRQRSPGCSMPLSSGERWLIASDRVRRRTRSEAARRGLVLFIESAHKLTGAAMSTLVHFADAHRAWRDRMLSRDARIYVVLATTPDRADTVLSTLTRFGVQGDVPVGREVTPLRQPELSLEEEQIVAALAAAPLALTESDVAAVFGLSARYLARSLVDRGFLRARAEYGETCFVPHPAYGEDSGLPPPQQRVLDGIARRYRVRARRHQGHEHLPFALATLEARRGRMGRALASLARTAHANSATVPGDLYEELVNHIASTAPVQSLDRPDHVQEEGANADPGPAGSPRRGCAVRGTHYALLCALHAHQRNYNQARAAAHRLTDQPIRNAEEFHRMLVQILCTGRTHMDAYLPDGFWAAIRVDGVDPSFVDATCILAELFARLRKMPQEEVLQVFEMAMQCFESASQADWREPSLDALLRALVDRVRIHVQALFPRRHSQAHPEFAPSSSAAPAYVHATLIYGVLCVPSTVETLFGEQDRSTAMDLVRATGHPTDSRIQYGGALQVCVVRRRQLLTRMLADEFVLLASTEASHALRRRLGLILQCMAGPRLWRLSAARLIPAHSSSQGHGDIVFESSCLARALMYTGDFIGARENLRAALVGKIRMPHSIAHYIQTQALLARKSLAWSELREACDTLERNRTLLPRRLYSHVRAFVDGSVRLCEGDFEAAEHLFRESRELCGTLAAGLSDLRVTAGVSESCSRLLQSGGWSRKAKFKQMIGRVIDEVISHGAYGAGAHNRVLAVLDYAALGLESWSRSHRVSAKDAAIGNALLLASSTDLACRPIGLSLIDGLATVAPSFFELLKEALHERVGLANCPGPETRAVTTALGHLRSAWSDAASDLGGHEMASLLRLPSSSVVKQAVRHSATWEEDASVYHALMSNVKRASEHVHRLETYGCLGVDRRSFQKLRLAWAETRHTPTLSEIRPVRLVDAQRTRAVGMLGVDRARKKSGREFLGLSAKAQEVRRLVRIAAQCKYPVLITGETGVGKDLVARSIHMLSPRATHDLVVADCAAVADGVLESELFGHTRGAFTGAVADHRGYFDRADGSTLFLDEVDSMSGRMQATLLRVLESGDYRPVGSQETRCSEFRLVSAAGPRLDQLMDNGQFRRDLYFRISTLRIHIPPLRERRNDIAVIGAAHADQQGVTITPDGLDRLAAHEWPGNVRQLRHCIDVASLEAEDGVITRSMLLQAIELSSTMPASGSSGGNANDAWAQVLELLRGGPFTAVEFARLIGVSQRSAQRHLGRLRRSGRIARVGAGRATQYQVRTEEL